MVPVSLESGIVRIQIFVGSCGAAIFKGGSGSPKSRSRLRPSFFLIIFFCLRAIYPEIFYFITMILIQQRIRIIVGEAGFEPGTSAPEVWCAANEPPHLFYI